MVLRDTNGQYTFSSYLTSGIHVLKIIFFKFASASTLTIKSIKVIGSEKTNTGGMQCNECPPSFIQTEAGKSFCTPCPLG